MRHLSLSLRHSHDGVDTVGGMKFLEQHQYDAAPVDVWAMLRDRSFREDVCRATGAREWAVGIDADVEGGTVTVTRVISANVSEAIKKLVGETVTIVQTEQWGAAVEDGARSADMHLDVEGQPATMTGTHSLVPQGAGTLFEVAGDLKVSIPLLGGRIEKEIAKAVSAGLREEHTLGETYLS